MKIAFTNSIQTEFGNSVSLQMHTHTNNESPYPNRCRLGASCTTKREDFLDIHCHVNIHCHKHPLSWYPWSFVYHKERRREDFLNIHCLGTHVCTCTSTHTDNDKVFLHTASTGRCGYQDPHQDMGIHSPCLSTHDSCITKEGHIGGAGP